MVSQWTLVFVLWIAAAGSAFSAGTTLHPHMVLQLGDSRLVKTVAITPDRQRALTASQHAVLLWDLATGREIRKLRHDDFVSAIAVSPDGRRVLTGSHDLIFRLWDLEKGHQIRQLRSEKDHRATTGSVTTPVAISPNGRQAITAVGNTARVWDLDTGSELGNLKGHSNKIEAVAFSSDGHRAVSGGYDKTARLWDIKTGSELLSLSGHIGPVTAVMFCCDDKLVFTGSSDFTVRLWDTETGKELRRVKFHTWSDGSVAFSPDGSRAITVSRQKRNAWMWDLETGELLRTFWSQKKAPPFYGSTKLVTCAAFSPDGRRALIGLGNMASFRDLETGKEVRRLQGRVGNVISAALSSDGSQLLTGGYDHTAKLWNLKVGRELRRIEHPHYVHATAFSHDSRKALIGGGNIFQVWDLDAGRKPRSYESDLPSSLTALAFTPDGQRALVGRQHWVDGLQIWNLESGRLEYQYFVGGGEPESVTFSLDGRRAIIGSRDGTVQFWDLDGGRKIRSWRGHSGGVQGVGFSVDGSQAITGGNDNTVRLWDLKTGAKRGVLGAHEDKVTSVAFSHNGRRALTGSDDGSVRQWRLGIREEICTLYGHDDSITAVSFFPGDRVALTSSWDGTTRLWNTTTCKEICRLVSFHSGSWAVATPEGRFDTDNLDRVSGWSWLFADDPLTPLSPEIYMRDYYEPRLLARVLAGEEFPPVRPLAGLNRAQPTVEITKVKAGSQVGTVDVVVEVGLVEGSVIRGGKTLPSKSVHDLRMFRNGYLVAQEPQPNLNDPPPEGTSDAELNAWGEATLLRPGVLRVVADDKFGHLTVTFKDILLPSQPGGEVEFSAYAFNADRVKSQTAEPHVYEIPSDVPPANPKAYVVFMGVNEYANPDFDLEFAAADARLMKDALTKSGRVKGYEVISVLLISEGREQTATKDSLRTALELLAGVEGTSEQAKLPVREKLVRVTPDDLVLVLFSGHGFTDEGNEFYLLPAEVGPSLRKGKRPSKAVLRRSISGEELAGWFRRIDAGEMTLVIDACHSAATVEQGWFKPGPMGSRGLGQLAYDKRMRVLAASQADDFAIESKRLRQGLLTYALVKDGLEKLKADFKPTDQRVTLGEWLAYGVERVPDLHRRIRGRLPLDDVASGGEANQEGAKAVIIERSQGETPRVVPATEELVRESTLAKDWAFQTPALFDFARGRRDVTIQQNGAD